MQWKSVVAEDSWEIYSRLFIETHCFEPAVFHLNTVTLNSGWQICVSAGLARIGL